MKYLWGLGLQNQIRTPPALVKLVGALSRTPKCCGFDPQSGHIHSCRFNPQSRCVWEPEWEKAAWAWVVTAEVQGSGLIQNYLESRAKIICWWMRCRVQKKRRVKANYEVCNLSNWKNRVAISWEYNTGVVKSLQAAWKPQGATKLTRSREEFKFKLSDAKIRALPLLPCCVCYYVVQFRVDCSAGSIGTDVRKV